MTSRDAMPFGKYKGQPISTVPEEYLDWLVEQEWLSKWPKLKLLLEKGESEETTTTLERKNIDNEAELLKDQSPAFVAFWKRSYGERMRVHGELNYIAFLRVAITTWQACSDQTNFKLASPPPPKPRPEMMPPPFQNIPKPDILKDPLPAESASGSEADEPEPF